MVWITVCVWNGIVCDKSPHMSRAATVTSSNYCNMGQQQPGVRNTVTCANNLTCMAPSRAATFKIRYKRRNAWAHTIVMFDNFLVVTSPCCVTTKCLAFVLPWCAYHIDACHVVPRRANPKSAQLYGVCHTISRNAIWSGLPRCGCNLSAWSLPLHLRGFPRLPQL